MPSAPAGTTSRPRWRGCNDQEATSAAAPRGAGRKPKSKSGELMKTRAMRWTDEGWADVLLIGMDRVRELVAKEAAKVRKQQGNE